MKSKLVILFSGGLDSLVSYHYALTAYKAEDILCLHVNIGQPYGPFEWESLKAFEANTGKRVHVLDCPILADREYAYSKPTVGSHFIPGRNLTLISLAANYGNLVWCNTLYEDVVFDTTEEFFNRTSILLSRAYDQPIEVVSPLRHLTKVEMVKMALELGVPEAHLRSSVSCYSPTMIDGQVYFCGKCATCFRRAVAMLNSGILEPYLSNPLASDFAKRIKKAWESKGKNLVDDVDRAARIYSEHVMERHNEVSLPL